MRDTVVIEMMPGEVTPGQRWTKRASAARVCSIVYRLRTERRPKPVVTTEVTL
ncbi:hypothetical protein ABIA39_003928 [Nocardia sp. GAS34]